MIKLFHRWIDPKEIIGLGPLMVISKDNAIHNAFRIRTFSFQIYLKHYAITIEETFCLDEKEVDGFENRTRKEAKLFQDKYNDLEALFDPTKDANLAFKLAEVYRKKPEIAGRVT